MPSPISSQVDNKLDERVEALLENMSLEEKIGQMTQVEKNSLSPQDVSEYFIGSVLSGGGGYPENNSPQAWAEMVHNFQKYALLTRLQIPLLYGVDAVHGHNSMLGAVIFPHNIGLGAAGDADLVFQIARATAEELVSTGIYWNFAPAVTVPHDIRWGRTYEGFSEDTELVSILGSAYVRGLQGDRLNRSTSVLATPKHYLGDGGTSWRSSNIRNFLLDQGNTVADEATLRKHYLPPYISAIQQGALCIMASYSSWNGLKMSATAYLLTDLLKGELGFRGFIVSDWQALDQLSRDYYRAVVLAINAGIDMNMVPYDFRRFISTLLEAVKRKDVPESRIDDAVSRILRVKLQLGLFDRPFDIPGSFSAVGTDAHRALARRAVSQSLVLLKNNSHILPLSQDTGSILIAGKAADNLGMQCGGWTIEWMGMDGNNIPGTTLLQGVRNKVAGNTRLHYAPSAQSAREENVYHDASPAEVGIVVVGEEPYAEGVGDRENLALPPEDIELISEVRARCHRLVVILISGRPMIITDQLPIVDAFVCAWLPGQEGEGIADVLFGDKPFTGHLPYTWPRSMAQLPFDFEHLPAGEQAPLFARGYGLTGGE
jgi:beta-glucosidase